MEYTGTGCTCVCGDQFPPLTDQHRNLRRSQRHKLVRSCLTSVFVHSNHWLPDLASLVRSSIAPQEMVIGQIWPCSERRFALLCSTNTILRFLASGEGRYSVSEPYLYSYFETLTRMSSAGFNWSSVMFVGIMILSLIYYITHARHVYVGPVKLVKREQHD